MSLMLVVLILSTSPWENSVLSTSTSISSKKENERNAHRLAGQILLLPSHQQGAGSRPVRDKAAVHRKTFSVLSGVGWAVDMISKKTRYQRGVFLRDLAKGLTPPACRPHCHCRWATTGTGHSSLALYYPSVGNKKIQIEERVTEKMEREVIPKHTTCLILHCQSSDHSYRALQCITMGI